MRRILCFFGIHKWVFEYTRTAKGNCGLGDKCEICGTWHKDATKWNRKKGANHE